MNKTRQNVVYLTVILDGENVILRKDQLTRNKNDILYLSIIVLVRIQSIPHCQKNKTKQNKTKTKKNKKTIFLVRS